jgi:hypothetical protein
VRLAPTYSACANDSYDDMIICSDASVHRYADAGKNESQEQRKGYEKRTLERSKKRLDP